MIVWLNGELTKAEHARIDPTDRGFLLGDGLFETLKAPHGQAVFADRHLDRLAHGAKILGIEINHDRATLKSAMTALLAGNALETAPRAALRLTLTRGPGPRGLLPPLESTPTLLMTCFPCAPPRLSACAITTTVRRNEFSPTANLKVLPYLDQILARREAEAAGADEAILLNTQGKVVCASAANLFLWDADTLLTPPLGDGCMDGTIRRAVIEVARHLGIECFEESLPPSTLASVESAFLTNSLVGLQSLARVDGRKLGEHKAMGQLRAALEQAEQASLPS